ncbi:hypothetical protein ACR52_16640 [Pseudomonas fildesensis]|uniref:Uncharacterized protein n=1 Tax=Pseudomonas fildesensis TaxID=1674920 RepID=A0A0J8G0C5_9PSED|nr:hypothetical protein ACR52_16640 [Pseudomonas fildesensis]
MSCERGGRSLQAYVNSDIKVRNPVAEQKILDVCWNLARIVAYVRQQLYGERGMVLLMSAAWLAIGKGIGRLIYSSSTAEGFHLTGIWPIFRSPLY